MNLLPFQMDSQVIAEKVNAFRTLDDCILRNFADILLAAMTILYKIFLSVVEGGFGGRLQV